LILLQCCFSLDQKAEIITHSWKGQTKAQRRAEIFFAHGELQRGSVTCRGGIYGTPRTLGSLTPMSLLCHHHSSKPSVQSASQRMDGYGYVCKPRAILANCNHRKQKIAMKRLILIVLLVVSNLI